MTHNGNWFAVSRMVFDHYIVGAAQPVKPADAKKGSYSKMEAWLDLIAMAAYEPSKIMNKGREQSLQPGQMMGGYAFLAERWNWSVETVRWFVKQLEIALMITRHCNKLKADRNTNQVQVLSIYNYSNYQLGNYAQPQASPQALPTANPKPTPSAPHESNNKQITNRESEAEASEPVTVNCTAIHGPNFKLDFGAIDTVAVLASMGKDRARLIAEVLARDWAATGKLPQYPMAAVKKAIINDANQGQVREVRMEKAKAGAPEARQARMRQYVEDAAKKLSQERKV